MKVYTNISTIQIYKRAVHNACLAQNISAKTRHGFRPQGRIQNTAHFMPLSSENRVVSDPGSKSEGSDMGEE